MTSVVDSSQIHSTFISLIIDGKEYGSLASDNDGIIGPQAITSLKVEKKTSDASNVATGFIFTIDLNYLMYPDFYETILRLIKEHPDGLIPAKIQYGYSEGGLCSPVYELALLSCQPKDLWQTLELQFISGEYETKYNAFTDMTNEDLANNKYYNLSRFVEAVAYNQGWEIGEIVETIPYNTDPEGNPDDYIKFPEKCSSNPITAIMSLLKTYPNNSIHGEGGYIAGFKHYVGGSKFYFVPTTELVHEYDFNNVTHTYEFYFNALPKGNVISFTPKLLSALADSAGNSDPLDASRLVFEDRPDIGIITEDSRELLSITYDIEPTGISQVNSARELDSAAGFREPTIDRIANVGADDIVSHFKSKITENMSKYVNVIGVRNTAELVVLGDPSLNVMDYINVIPMYHVRSYTTPNKMHPSGGIYWVKQIVDTIENGVFQTSMSLVAESSKDFKLGEISTLTMAFEQADNVESGALNKNLEDALGKTARSQSGSARTTQIAKKAIDDAVAWAVNIANDDSHKYSMEARWGPHYDCSSFVISAWQDGAGVPVKDNGATTTESMVDAFLATDFKDVSAEIDKSSGRGLKKGDVLINVSGEGRSGDLAKYGHAAMVQSDNPLKIVAANGSSTGINADKDYYNCPYSYILRYSKADA